MDPVMDDESFRRLLLYFNFSWQGYRKVRKAVKKRISRHMAELGCGDVDAYLQLLASHPAVRAEGERRMSVSISRFFRDRRLWEIIEGDILPRFSRQEELRVWSAGCARGEEAYTFAILYEGFAAGRDRCPRLFLTASDIHPEVLDQAEKGVYPVSALKEVDPAARGLWFDRVRRQYQVKDRFRKYITWERRHLLHAPPPDGPFDLVFLRNNILTYPEGELRKKGFENAASALDTGGFLAIGSKERLPEGAAGFESYHLPYLFLKTGDGLPF